jgi:hypothetical protein
MHTGRHLSAIALLAVTAVACSGGGKDGAAKQETDRVPRPVTIPSVAVADPTTGVVSDYSLPLEAYMPTPEQIRDLNNASIMLQNDCLQRFGFPGKLPLKADAPDFLTKVNPTRFGPTDPAVAQQHGYRNPNSGTLKPPAPSTLAPLTEAETALLSGKGASEVNGTGVPPGGCFGEAQAKLAEGGPPTPKEEAYARNLASRLLGPVSQDERLVAAQAKWSACMKAAGFVYKNTTEAMQDQSWTSPTPSPREIQTAVADVRCKQETKLSDIGIAVWTAYEQQAIELHAEELTTYKSWVTNATRNAARVLAGK